MSTPRIITTAFAAGLLATGLAPLPGRAQENDRPPRSDQAQSDQEEVLTRGPVHEAFATAVTFDPEPGLTISVKPPEVIDELPPEQQLEGDNVAWIPGYWAWDEEREDFLWISGIWRNLPPDRQWVPGYWDDLGGTRYQWISGYWADAAATEVSYLPEPPKALESRPNVDPPSSSDTWIPGNWVWVDTRYRWRPGYWEPLRENWTYVPDQYRWTPRGYIYIGGYWDYAPVRRGIIFAPVYFSRDYYGRPGFHYTPSIVISVSTVVDHLFIRPRYGHYYFGDYYEPRYRQEGFVASFSYGAGSVVGYDPIYAYARWSHRDDRDWDRRQREDFDYFRDNRDARPPRRWSELRDLGDGRRGAKIRDRDYMVATPLADFAKAPERGEKFRKLDGQAREQAMTRRKEMQDFRQERRQQETANKREGKPETAEKVKLGRSPILGRRAAELAKGDAPPPRKEAPAPVDPDATKDKPKAAEERQRPADEGAKPMPPDREGRPQRDREGQPEGEREAKPQREREAQPQKEREVKPDREAKPQREREVQPQKEREIQPQKEREAQPQKEREAQPQPKREVQPQKEREAQPQRERQPQPQKEREAQPQRERQPQPQKEREAQPQPKREAQPQRPPQGEKPKPRERDKEKDKEEKKE